MAKRKRKPDEYEICNPTPQGIAHMARLFRESQEAHGITIKIAEELLSVLDEDIGLIVSAGSEDANIVRAALELLIAARTEDIRVLQGGIDEIETA